MYIYVFTYIYIYLHIYIHMYTFIFLYISVCCKMKALLQQRPDAIRNASLFEQYIFICQHSYIYMTWLIRRFLAHWGRARRDMTNPHVYMWHVSDWHASFMLCCVMCCCVTCLVHRYVAVRWCWGNQRASACVQHIIHMVWHGSFRWCDMTHSDGVTCLIQMVWHDPFLFVGVLQSHGGWASREPVCGGGVIFQWQSGLCVPACPRKTHWYAHAL